MNTTRFSKRPDRAPRPRDALKAAEDAAIRHQRFVAALRAGFGDLVQPGSLDDASRLAELIEQLARYGQSLPAAEAMDLAERLEVLILELADRAFEFLASTVSV